MFFLLLAILCLGILNWKLVVAALLFVLVINYPIIAIVFTLVCVVGFLFVKEKI